MNSTREPARRVPLVRPRTPDLDAIAEPIRVALETGMLTNGANVSRFEAAMADYLGAAEAVAVCNATTGLIMTLSVLGLSGEILVPSFTFSATGHACYWAGLRPVFVDCDARDWTISLSDCLRTISPQTSAVLAVHTFGNPADVGALEDFARDNGLAVVYDAAHAIGTRVRGRTVGGAGTASVFSLTPTKIITSGEGGVITTDDPLLARELRVFRNYGDPGTYDCRAVGLNGRMSELAAIVGLATLRWADEEVAARTRIAGRYARRLAALPGIHVQHVREHCASSWKDFTIVVDERRFGTDRDAVAAALADAGVDTRRYFDPPLHRQSAYAERGFRQSALAVTETISPRVLSLPIHSSMTDADVDHVCDVIASVHQRRRAADPTPGSLVGAER